jgi:Flp pilus assembly protein TadG
MRRPVRNRGIRGAAYVEFLAVVFPLLTLFLGLTQLALIYGADLLVQQAAARAARAAIVILPDDHEEADYGGVPLNQIGGGGDDGLAAYTDAPSGGRLAAIRDAARITLAPISPAIESFAGSSVAAALGESSAATVLAGLVGWTEWAVAVSFPDGEGGFRTAFDPRGPVTARVTFLYRCAIPLARRLMCAGVEDLPTARREALLTNGGALAGAAALGGWRLVALEAERTLPNQGR